VAVMIVVLSISLGMSSVTVSAEEPFKKVMIDAGHGGTDSGAVGNGLREKDLTLKLATLINNHLNNNYDVTTKMTRTSDTTVSLPQRTRMANEWNADIFLSIHINAGGGTGFEDFTYSGRMAQPRSVQNESKEIQQVIHAEIKEVLKKYNVRDRGTKEANFHVLRETKMPSLLTETMFIDNAHDANLLKNENFINDIAIAHSRGTAKALNLPIKGTSSGFKEEQETTPAPAPAPEVKPEGKVYETTANLNVRSGAGAKNSFLTNAIKGTKVTITNTQKVGNETWGYGTVNGKTGWMSMAYMKADNQLTVTPKPPVVKPNPTPAPKPTPKPEVQLNNKVYETTANLNVRSGADAKNKILTNAKKDTKVTITKTQKVGSVTWGYGKANGKNGWMSMAYMKAYNQPTVTPKPPVVKPKPTPKPPVVQLSNKVYETTANLNVRSAAGAKNKYLTNAKKGTKVTITKTQKVGSVTWGYGKVNGKTGWMSMAYMKAYNQPTVKPKPVVEKVSAPKPTPKPPVVQSSNKVYETTANLNVRSGAGAKNKFLTNAKKGTKVTITNTRKVGSVTWGYGKVNGKTGWMSMAYMKAYNSLL